MARRYHQWPLPLRPELRLVSTASCLGQHLSQSSAAAQHAQHVVACTHTRTRQWRHRTISRRHVVRCDRSSSRQVRDSWKARRRRTFSTRVSSVIGVKTLTRTFLKITRRSFCVKCLYIHDCSLNSKTVPFPTHCTPLDTILAAGRVVSLTLESSC